MKKTASVKVAVSVLMVLFSMVLSSAALAADKSHTITIDNTSSTALKPTNNPHVVVYNNTTGCTAAGGAAVCDTANLTPNPPANIAAKAKGTVTMTGPEGCNVSAWQTFWTLNIKGNHGTVRCTKSPVNQCNGTAPNYTCTISDATVAKINGNGKAVVDADSVQ